MLCPVNENLTWAQAWYFPRVPDNERMELFKFYQFEGGSLDVDAIYRPWAINQQAIKERIERQREQSKQKAIKHVDSGLDAVKAFKESYPIEHCFEQYDYKQIGKKWLSPNSDSGIPGVIIQGSKWFSKHGSDSDMGAPHDKGGRFGDAFDLFVFFEHGNDYNKAVIAAGEMFKTAEGKTFNKAKRIEYMAAQANESTSVDIDVDAIIRNGQKQPDIDYSTMPDYPNEPPTSESNPPQSTFNATLDSEHKYCTVELLRHVDDSHILKQLSMQTAAATNLPVNTVFLIGLTVFSSMAARKYAVQYQHSGNLPIGLYSVVEQPSGTGKSWCLGIFTKPFVAIQKRLKSEIQKEINRLDKVIENGNDLSDEEQLEYDELVKRRARLNTGLFVTNATPEGLEMTLPKTNGFFSALSSEQGLFNSLLGTTYRSENANNNDVMLNGFDGGHVNSIRVSRDGYNGNVVGSVACFAQQGSIEVVLKASNGTGLAERFLMLVEPHSLGKRDHTRQGYQDPFVIVNYDMACDIISDILVDPLTFDSLRNLRISTSGFLKINQYRNKIEPDLIDGGKFSHISLRGAASKINMQIMKIAANLHLMDGGQYVPEIADRHIVAAIDIANELLEANLKLCKDKGIMGVRAEFTAVLNHIAAKNNPRSERDLINSLRTTQPFKDFSGSRSELIKSTLSEMLTQRLLTKTFDASSGKALYALGQ